MKKTEHNITLSATDLSNYIACRHVTYLDLSAANGSIKAPQHRDPALIILQQRGLEFEQAYLKSLREQGLTIAEPDGDEKLTSIERTIKAMQEGVDVIYQASLKMGVWQGFADFLKKVDKPSKLGAWSYEVIDSKLAKDTRAGTILQICLYSQMVEAIQGVLPEFMHVMTPEDNFTMHDYRVNDFIAYHRLAQRGLLDAIAKGTAEPYTYPDPVPHCDICQWWQDCDKHRRKDDHLSLVAGISGLQVTEVKKWEVDTLEKLAKLPMPITQKPSRGSIETYERVREQARVQLQAREKHEPVYELLEVTEEQGFYRLPEPSDGDIFFDFEGDPFVGTTGLEYLFGYVLLNESNDAYHPIWALSPEQEKKAFEEFVDMVMARWQTYPGLHIYHYTPYEPSALKRLMGKYATREDEIDRLLRAEIFIDLHSIIKQTIRAGIEKYSLKDLEVFHGFTRELPLKDASTNLRAIERLLESNNASNIPEEIITAVEIYNKEDCISTKSLRDWLEQLRDELIQQGKDIARPLKKEGDASDNLKEFQKRIQPIKKKLLEGISLIATERKEPSLQSRWLLGNMLDWYRSENKATWWEYFRLRKLSDEELLEERTAVAGLEFTGIRQNINRSVIDRYTYPFQECGLKKGDKLYCGEDNKRFADVVAINNVDRTIDIKKGPSQEAIHPSAVFTISIVDDSVKEEAIIRIATWVADNGIDADGPYRAGRDLLLGKPPRPNAPSLTHNDSVHLAVEWVQVLDNSILPIQGPPGAGKSYTAAQMIIALVRAGKKVGITALSHKVIRGLMEKVIHAAEEQNMPLQCIQKVSTLSTHIHPRLKEAEKGPVVLNALKSGEAQVAGGTAWLWAGEDFAEAVDVLFVDEAGQLSLIDAIAVSQAAKNMVLLGDPQQLKQPQQGSHPEGTDVSALEHILQEHKTIPADRGIFLNETWRMHPKICAFISELFYEGRLTSRPDLINQQVDGNTIFKGAGLWFEPVIHNSNQSSSIEEAERIAAIVTELTKGDVFYTDKQGERKPLTIADIMVIAPYNAQVAELAKKLPTGSHIGTVDKFQGQEAPIVIFSMSTSSPKDAPRGMEFLYSLNRLNVAVSRAKAVCIIVANPQLFEPDCKSPEQMKLANAFCRYLEMRQPPSFGERKQSPVFD
jgi:predicted RecB family nuclease